MDETNETPERHPDNENLRDCCFTPKDGPHDWGCDPYVGME